MKTFKQLIAWMVLFAIIFLLVIWVNHTGAEEVYEAPEPVQEVKLDCSQNMHTESCIKRITDKFAEDLAAVEAQKEVVAREQEKLDDLTTQYNQSVFNLEKIAN